MNPEQQVRAVDAVRRWFAEERGAGFSTLLRVPSTAVQRFVDHFTALPVTEQDLLAEALAGRGAEFLCPPLSARVPATGVLGRLDEAMQWRGFGGGLRYTPVPLLAGIAKDAAVGGIAGWCGSMGFAGRSMELPGHLISSVEALVPVKPAAFQRRVKAALQARFGLTSENLGDSMWRYRGTVEGCGVSLSVIHRRRLGDPDLRYGLVLGRGAWLTSNQTSYEAVLGAAGLGWDYLTEENAERSVTLFCDLVERLARGVAEL